MFYEKGAELLRAGGVLCYITSNKWMRANYGKSLRKYFASKNPLQIMDLGPGNFDAATVDTNILLIQNRKTKKHQLQALTLLDKEKIHQLHLDDFTRMTVLDEQSWIILSPEEQAIKAKIERIGTPLKEWDVNINYGIKTGYNKAFIIDGELRDQLIDEDPKSAEIIKPLLRGRDIKRYRARFTDLWLIATFPAKNLNINDYTAVKRFLEGLKPKLKQEGKPLTKDEKDAMAKHGSYFGLNISFSSREKSRKKTSNKWFETQDQIGYYKDFKKEKVIYPNMTKYLPFIYDENKNYFINDKAFILSGESLKYLVSYLNSSIGYYQLKQKCAELQGGTRELRKIYVETIPIPKIPPSSQVPFTSLVDSILSKKEMSQVTTLEEQQIDLMVYQLYELTYEEVLVVDLDTLISREEYEGFSLENL